MIFYFTATGNCLYVAKCLDNEVYSISQEMKKELRKYKSESIGIVCPVYGHEMPKYVKEFIKNSEFDTDYFYIVLTYGFHHGGAAELTSEFLNSVGRKANYINTIIMVDNALPGFDIEEQLKIDPDKKVDEHIEYIRKDITEHKIYVQAATEIDKQHHQVYLKRSKKIDVSIDKPLYKISDECIGCGICTKVCPVGCICIENKKAYHTYLNCTTCLACIHACPRYAIKMVMGEKNPNAHYRNSNIKITEIIKSNNQN